MQDELDFYNSQFAKYQQYDRQRTKNQSLNLELAEDYFVHLVKSYSSKQRTLVDLGCGDGYFTKTLSTLNHSVIGIEPSDLIHAAIQLLDSEQCPHLIFLKEDAYYLSLADSSVDVVISRRGPDPEQEILRVLKEGGVFIFITIGELDCQALKQVVGRGQHFGTTKRVSEQLKDKFLDSGFAEVSCKEFEYEDNYDSSEALKRFLHQVPIFDDFSSADYKMVEQYCRHYTNHNITLPRHRVVLVAQKVAISD